jgi:hypothetical protein
LRLRLSTVQIRPLSILTSILNELAQDEQRLALYPRGLLRCIRKHVAALPARIKLERGIATTPGAADEVTEEVLRVMANEKEALEQALEKIVEEVGSPSESPVMSPAEVVRVLEP